MKPLLDHAELLLKLGTAVLGSLYVLGLLISNVQLMELGISDFTSLQARNVMTGCLFVFYLAVMIASLAPISVALYACGRAIVTRTVGWSRTLLACLGILVVAAFVFGLVVYLAGLIVGYLYPGGRPWEADFSRAAYTWVFTKSDF